MKNKLNMICSCKHKNVLIAHATSRVVYCPLSLADVFLAAMLLNIANFKVSIKLPPSDESTLNKFARIIFVIPPLNFQAEE